MQLNWPGNTQENYVMTLFTQLYIILINWAKYPKYTDNVIAMETEHVLSEKDYLAKWCYHSLGILSGNIIFPYFPS